jgi:hypothetical protein
MRRIQVIKSKEKLLSPLMFGIEWNRSSRYRAREGLHVFGVMYSPLTVEGRVPDAVGQIEVPLRSQRLERRKLSGGKSGAFHIEPNSLVIGINVVEFSQGIDESGYGDRFAGSTICFQDGRDTAGVTRPDRCIDQGSFKAGHSDLRPGGDRHFAYFQARCVFSTEHDDLTFFVAEGEGRLALFASKSAIKGLLGQPARWSGFLALLVIDAEFVRNVVHEFVHEESAGVAQIGVRRPDGGGDFKRVRIAPSVSLKLICVVAAGEHETAGGWRFGEVVNELIE